MSKLAKSTIGLMIIMIVSKVLGFSREIVLGSTYGISMYTDAYVIATNIPVTVFNAIGLAIATTFIPLYYENKKELGEKESINFTNNILNIVIIISIIISIFGFMFSKELVSIFAVGFKGETLEVANNLTKIMIFGIVFIGISNIMVALLQINGKYLVSGLTGIPFNITVILSIILAKKYNYNILGIGIVTAMLSQVIFQIPFIRKYTSYSYSYYIDLRDKYIKKLIYLIAPVFIGVAVNQVNTIIDRSIASTLVEGSISALNYANRLNGFVMGIFITSIGSVIYPLLSNLTSQNDNKSFADTVIKCINSVVVLIIPISVGAIVLAKPIVKLLFQRGVFDSTATTMTSISLIFYSIGMLAFGLREILGKVFYALKDTKTPMLNGALSMIINIILNLTLVKYMEYAGLALATSLSAIICIILLFRSLDKKIEYFDQNKINITIFKSLLSALIMGLLTHISYRVLSELLGIGIFSEFISLFISVIIGIIVYAISIIILKVDEIVLFIEDIKNKFINKRIVSE